MSTAASAPASTSKTSGTTGTRTGRPTSSSIAAAAATPTPAPSTKSNNNQDAPKSADTILGAASAATNAVRVFGKAGGAVDGTTGTRTATSHTIPKPHLPVLIIPGFMSSGLEVKSSKLAESWEGKRLWLNLVSLGLAGFFTGIGSGQKQNLNSADGGSASKRLNSTSSRYDDDSDDDEDDAVEMESRRQKEAADHHLAVHRHNWIKHMSLMNDMKSEHPDIEVRAMEGLAGVDYLTPGALTNHLSYVFGPVIAALKGVGYQEGVNLDACPYDWRLPPSELEQRDRYFTRTMRTVENLYEKSGGMPVVLVCHSLGTKAGHYLLNFACAKAGRKWVDKYVHTYMPVGAPHLGAPKAMRASLTGDKMGLDTFLGDSEALAMGRSFGSGPWLIPSVLPSFAPANVYVGREGAFEIAIRSTVDIGPLVEDRDEVDLPKKLQLVLRYGERVLRTTYSPVQENKVTFEGKFVFSTGPDGPFAERCCSCCCQCCILRCSCCGACGDNTLFVSLNEPGIKAARGEKKKTEARKRCCSEGRALIWLKIISCWYLIKWVLILFGYLLYCINYKLWVVLADKINKSTDRSSQIAVGCPISMEQFVGDTGGRDIQVELRDDLEKSKCCRKVLENVPVVTVNIRWIPAEMKGNGRSKDCQVAEMKNNQCRRIGVLSAKHDKATWDYDASSGYGILKNEGYESALCSISDYYDSDPLAPRDGSKAPPVKNIKAIYGINIPTEVGAVYRRRKAVVERKHKVVSMYKLDHYARAEPKGLDGYVLEKGILRETRETPQMLDGPTKFKSSATATEFLRCSGDGTVPYWSLQYVRTWEKHCKVSITELDGAEHRAILADGRFHKTLIDYVTIMDDAAEKQV